MCGAKWAGCPFFSSSAAKKVMSVRPWATNARYMPNFCRMAVGTASLCTMYDMVLNRK
jgi:hypothetical protein